MLGLLIKALRLIKAGPGPQINNSLSEVCKTMATETTLVPDRDLRIFYNTRSMVLEEFIKKRIKIRMLYFSFNYIFGVL